jgi:hemolysin activation/secretion protein
MKTNLVRMAVLVVAAVTMAAPAFAGQTQAERERALRQSADPESALRWQIAPAKETGSLPANDAKQMKSEGGANAEVPTVEIGGVVYRIGIDTP